MHSALVVVIAMFRSSAAFDTINHPILLPRIKSRLGVSGFALASFLSCPICQKESNTPSETTRQARHLRGVL